MARRWARLGVRIVLFVLMLIGPMVLVICAAVVVRIIPERPAKTLLLVSAIWFFSAILLAPVILFPDSGSSGPGEGEGGGGGGGRPPRTPVPPAPPRGGIPLPDADQAAVRVRNHGRLAWPRLRRRRSERERERTPALPPSR